MKQLPSFQRILQREGSEGPAKMVAVQLDLRQANEAGRWRSDTTIY